MLLKAKGKVASFLWAVLPIALVAVVSAVFSRLGDPWYQSLDKPFFTPPDWAFPVAWGIVYVCCMASVYLFLRKGAGTDGHIWGYALIGLFNVMWSAVFFGANAATGGAIVLCILLAFVLLQIIGLMERSRASAWLLVPHVLWGLFAYALNIGIIFCNGVI